MNRITFLFSGSVPRNRRNLMGTLLTARRMAKQLDPSINKVLIIGTAHESSIRTATGEWVAAPLHYTFQFKNDELSKRNAHWSAHANIVIDSQTKQPKNWYDTILDLRSGEDKKTPIEYSDEYFSIQKQKKLNKWDPNQNEIKEYPEDVLEGWYIGETFIAYPKEQKGPVPPKELEEVQQDQKESKEAIEKAIALVAIHPKKPTEEL